MALPYNLFIIAVMNKSMTEATATLAVENTTSIQMTPILVIRARKI